MSKPKIDIITNSDIEKYKKARDDYFSYLSKNKEYFSKLDLNFLKAEKMEFSLKYPSVKKNNLGFSPNLENNNSNNNSLALDNSTKHKQSAKKKSHESKPVDSMEIDKDYLVKTAVIDNDKMREEFESQQPFIDEEDIKEIMAKEICEFSKLERNIHINSSSNINNPNNNMQID